MSDDDRARIQPDLEFMEFSQKAVLVEPYRPNDHVFFLESGLASQIAMDREGWRLEIGIYGREGIGPTAALLGVDQSPHLHIMQVGGVGYRISARALTKAMENSQSLRQLLLRWVHVFMIQMGNTALANNRTRIEQRTARWLAMSHDRLEGDELPLTHEFLGVMIGVRRASVTDAIQNLEDKGIIRARRGAIEIIDRVELDRVAGAAYGVPEAEYRRIIGEF